MSLLSGCPTTAAPGNQQQYMLRLTLYTPVLLSRTRTNTRTKCIIIIIIIIEIVLEAHKQIHTCKIEKKKKLFFFKFKNTK